MDDAFFIPRGEDRYLATEHTSGPWDPRLQHAGPPAALLARELERLEPQRPEMLISRITTEILHAIPVGEVEVNAKTARPGKGVELLEASMRGGGRELLRAAAWRIARAPDDLEAAAPAYEPPPLPECETSNAAGADVGYLNAIEWRYASGAFGEAGPAAAWTRMRHPLVPGEEPSGLQRVLTVADSGNGISSLLDWKQWWFINTDLTVHVEREPAGEWICLDAVTSIQPGGAGLATSVLSDRDGPVARGAQTLLVGRRN